jgi:two-component system, chemotaxis family, protein-glutamate methylesterase/glutaminase
MSGGHDIVVIGASAGGMAALRQLLAKLPRDLAASLFVVLHLSPHGPSALPTILTRSGPLPAAHPEDGERIERGKIYVAPPNRHMLVVDGHIRLNFGPKENHTRPAIDPLFRSAALHCGTRVIGIVLSGLLDDGTAGLVAVKARGGISVVQDPDDAEHGSMPRNAIAGDTPDHVVPVEAMGPLIARLVATTPPPENDFPVPKWLTIESLIEEEATMSSIETTDQLGQPSSFVCPECKGALYEVENDKLLRFRCHVGHAYSAASLEAHQDDDLEGAMWMALRALQESAALSRRLAHRARLQGKERAAEAHAVKAAERERQADVIRAAISGELPGTAELASE